MVGKDDVSLTLVAGIGGKDLIQSPVHSYWPTVFPVHVVVDVIAGDDCFSRRGFNGHRLEAR